MRYELQTLNTKMEKLMETYSNEPNIDMRATIAGMIILMKGFISEVEMWLAMAGEDRPPEHTYDKNFKWPERPTREKS
jgi:hypothetical protein